MRSFWPAFQSMRVDHSFPLNKLPFSDVCEPNTSEFSLRNGMFRSVITPACKAGGAPRYVAQLATGVGSVLLLGCVPERYAWSAGVIPNRWVNWFVANPIKPFGKLAGHI